MSSSIGNIPPQIFAPGFKFPHLDIDADSMEKVSFALFNTLQLQVQYSLRYLSVYFERTGLVSPKEEKQHLLDYHLENIENLSIKKIEDLVHGNIRKIIKIEKDVKENKKKRIAHRDSVDTNTELLKENLSEIALLKNKRRKAEREDKEAIQKELQDTFFKGKSLRNERIQLMESTENKKDIYESKMREARTLVHQNKGLVKLLEYERDLEDFLSRIQPFTKACLALRDEYVHHKQLNIKKVSSKNLDELFDKTFQSFVAMEYMVARGYSLDAYEQEAHIKWKIIDLEKATEGLTKFIQVLLNNYDFPLESSPNMNWLSKGHDVVKE